jgi:hypothetical protein
MNILAFALNWEPQLHGITVVALSIVLLCGSVYLLLATNMGSRVGFMVAAGGLAGWMLLMGIVWATYGIGLTGRAPAWHVEEVLTGSAASADQVLDEYPQGWEKIPIDSPELSEAIAAADPTLAPPAETGRKGPYTSSSDYLPVAAYEKGGERYFLTLKGKPHHIVIEVQKATKPAAAAPGQPAPKATADPNAPVTKAVLIRDQGTLRQPGAVVALCSFVLFGVICYSLHRRDKEAMAAKGTALEPVGRD